MNLRNGLKVGDELDAAVCREVFGMPEAKIARLKARGRLPRYSEGQSQKGVINAHFVCLGGADPTNRTVQRYNEAMEFLARACPLMANKVNILTTPSLVCDMALFAVRHQEADDIGDLLVEDRAATEEGP